MSRHHWTSRLVAIGACSEAVRWARMADLVRAHYHEPPVLP